METMKQAKTISELKRAYRKLAFENHPDRGGSEEKMKEINAVFAELYDSFKSGTYKATQKDEEDYGTSYTAKQYTDFVYSEYGWTGSRYDSKLNLSEICKRIKSWAKEKFPTCRFNVNKSGYGSVNVILVSGDFEAFTDERDKRHFNRFHKSEEQGLTPRCYEVLRLVTEYAESYNYDNSDIMTDYFDTNFYLRVEVGEWNKAYINTAKVVNGERYEKTATEKKMQKALGSGNWVYWIERRGQFDYYLCDKADADKLYPLTYSQPSVRRARMKKMEEAGLKVKYTNQMYSTIIVENWDDILKKIDEERTERRAKKEAYCEHTESCTKWEGVRIVDYSEKALAVIGETMKIKDELKRMGGRFNKYLKCGAGWIFSKTKENELKCKIA